mmetsp:Transcript_15876/g.34351  ORF Transcript_15876/g.34351 Transcript_15876/m.34351 type:complete len:533 (-) Transcript_15876:46-1644(-)
MLPRANDAQRQRMLTQVKGVNKVSLLLFVLAVAIFLFATAPIFLHHSMVRPTNKAPHQLLPRKGKTSTIEIVKYELDDKEVFNFAYEDEHTTNVTLPPDIGGAGRALLLSALEERPIWDDDIDPEIETERCRKYFSYRDYKKYYTDYKPRKRRRVFLGSLIADDSWHALGALAMETYGVYTAVAFVESNRTQTGDPRKLRFANGTVEHKILVESNLFGPNTPVLMGYFEYEGKIDGGGLIREHMQRNMIIDLWKKAGMTPEDVGVLTDADETLTRDFLRAVQTCDMPELNPETQNCHTAKVIASSQVFEGSPECMTVTRKWMHPDLILGKCIEGIGDDEFKLDDTQRQRKFAWRKKEYTQKFGNYSGWPKDKTTFPLWNPADFRRDQGGHTIIFERVDYLPFGMGHTGYHFHNYFGTPQQLRKKYMTYGHPVKEAENMSVAEMHPDLDVMVDCVLGRSTANNKHNTLSTRLEEFEGRVPLAYGLVEGYTMARHFELKSILMEEERGQNTWHDNPKSKDWFEKLREKAAIELA